MENNASAPVIRVNKLRCLEGKTALCSFRNQGDHAGLSLAQSPLIAEEIAKKEI